MENETKREYSLSCSECGQELQPGEPVVAGTLGDIGDDGGFYPGDDPYLWVRHPAVCPKG